MADEVTSENPAEILRGLRPDEADRFVELLVRKLDLSLGKVLPEALERGVRSFGFTEEVAGLVRLLAARSGDPKENVLLKALTLYGLALDAREKGNRLAILNAEDEIIHDVIGFESSTPIADFHY